MDIFANFLLVTWSCEIWHAPMKRDVWGKSEAKRLKQKQVWTRPWSLELCVCYLCVSVCLVVRGEQVNTGSLVLPGELKDLRLLHHEIDHMWVWAGLHCIIGASCLLVGGGGGAGGGGRGPAHRGGRGGGTCGGGGGGGGGTVLERCVTARRECVCVCVCEYMDGNQSRYKCWCVPAMFKLEQGTQGGKKEEEIRQREKI